MKVLVENDLEIAIQKIRCHDANHNVLLKNRDLALTLVNNISQKSKKY